MTYKHEQKLKTQLISRLNATILNQYRKLANKDILIAKLKKQKNTNAKIEKLKERLNNRKLVEKQYYQSRAKIVEMQEQDKEKERLIAFWKKRYMTMEKMFGKVDNL
jgi:hypothetical protein